jgi:hypothetical protein
MARITAKQKSARRKNIAIARAAKKKGSGSSAKSRAKKAYASAYKEARKYGSSKEFSHVTGLKAAHKKSARYTYKIARAYALAKGRKYGYSKTGASQYATGFTKALRKGY